MKKQSLLLQSLVLSLLFCLLLPLQYEPLRYEEPLQVKPLQFKSLQPMQALGANFSFSQPGQGWVKDERGWKYRFESGPWFTGGWHTINQRRYHFDRDGYMEHGWYTENGSWYYLGIPGDESTGLLRRGWITDEGKRYFLDADGIMKTGWLMMGEDWFYLKASGAAAVGETLELGGQRCTFREDGVLQGTRPLGDPDSGDAPIRKPDSGDTPIASEDIAYGNPFSTSDAPAVQQQGVQTGRQIGIIYPE